MTVFTRGLSVWRLAVCLGFGMFGVWNVYCFIFTNLSPHSSISASVCSTDSRPL